MSNKEEKKDKIFKTYPDKECVSNTVRYGKRERERKHNGRTRKIYESNKMSLTSNPSLSIYSNDVAPSLPLASRNCHIVPTTPAHNRIILTNNVLKERVNTFSIANVIGNSYNIE